MLRFIVDLNALVRLFVNVVVVVCLLVCLFLH